MAEALVTGASDTSNIGSKRLKRDVSGGPKGKVGINVPISSRRKKKKSKGEL